GGPKKWSIWAGALPAGITLSPDGVLSGTPTVGGNFTFIAQVAIGDRSDTQTLTLTVVQPLKIGQATAPAAEVDRPFRMELTATGGDGRHTWATYGGTVLPAGLTLDPATGVISGRPLVSGSFAVKLAATDQLGFSDIVDVQVAVAGKLALTREALPAGRPGRMYRAVLAVRGGVAPREWTILRGSLPAGITLDKARGSLSGIPHQVGTFRVWMQVRDRLGATSTATYILKVLP